MLGFKCEDEILHILKKNKKVKQHMWGKLTSIMSWSFGLKI